MSLRLITLLICCCALLTSCNGDGEWKDEGIDPKIRAEISLMNKKVLDAIGKNDVKGFLSIGNDTFKHMRKDSMAAFIDWLHYEVNVDTFSIRRQFYIRDHKGFSQRITTGNGDHDFSFGVKQLERDMVVTMIDIPDSIQVTTITTVFTRTKGDWKLHGLRVGVYKLFGMDAPSWFRKAEDEYSKGAEVDGYLHMLIVDRLMKPSADYVSYNIEPQMLHALKKMTAEVKEHYPLPVTANAIAGLPTIFNVSSRLYGHDMCNVVSLKTTFSLTDTTTISRMCDTLHAGLDHEFPKLNRNQNLLYDVYNENETYKITFVKHALKKYWQYAD